MIKSGGLLGVRGEVALAVVAIVFALAFVLNPSNWDMKGTPAICEQIEASDCEVGEQGEFYLVKVGPMHYLVLVQDGKVIHVQQITQ